jgi:putative solute:sodium symporter small subunit
METDMLERSERRPYWRATKRGVALALAPLAVALILFPLYAEQLNSNRFLGFPLGYFLSAHGTIILAVATIATFVSRQHALDQLHGAHDDM